MRCGLRPTAGGCSRSTARIRSCSTRRWRRRFSVVTRCHVTMLLATGLCRGRRDRPRPGVRARDRLARPCRTSFVGRGTRRSAPRPSSRRPRVGGDLSSLPGPHRRALRRPGSRPLRLLRDLLTLRSVADRDALWAGLADGSPTSSRPTTSLIASASKRQRPAPCHSTSSATVPPVSRPCSRSYIAKGSRADGSRSSGWSSCYRRRRPCASASSIRFEGPPPSPFRSIRMPSTISRPFPPHQRLHAL